jgi:hypothetical protein
VKRILIPALIASVLLLAGCGEGSVRFERDPPGDAEVYEEINKATNCDALLAIAQVEQEGLDYDEGDPAKHVAYRDAAIGRMVDLHCYEGNTQ